MATRRQTAQPTGNEVLTLEQIYNGDTARPLAEFDPGTVGLDDDPDIALATTLASLGESDSDARVLVYAIDDKGGRAYCCTMAPTEFASSGMDDIRNRFGGGDYAVRVIGGDGKVKTHRRIKIKTSAIPSAPQAQAQALNGLTELAQAMQTGFMQLGRMMADQAQAQPKAPDRMEMLREMQLMRELFAPAPAQGGMMDSLGMVRELIGITRDLTPPTNSDGETDPMGVLWKALEMFGKPLAAGMSAMQSPQVSTLTTAPASLPAPNPIPAPNPVSDEADQMNFFIKQVIKHLIQKARAGESVAQVAEEVLDQAPAGLVNQIMTDPAWFGPILAIDPTAAEVKPWFDALHGEIKAILTDDDNPGDDSGSLLSPVAGK